MDAIYNILSILEIKTAEVVFALFINIYCDLCSMIEVVEMYKVNVCSNNH